MDSFIHNVTKAFVCASFLQQLLFHCAEVSSTVHSVIPLLLEAHWQGTLACLASCKERLYAAAPFSLAVLII